LGSRAVVSEKMGGSRAVSPLLTPCANGDSHRDLQREQNATNN